MEQDRSVDECQRAADTRERLESWKEIAAYLRRDVRTVHRWERDEGLPVHRHVHNVRSTVYAHRAELDRWRLARRARRVSTPEQPRRVLLAVLPFENLSGIPEDEYFSDGLTEDVITELGRSPADNLGIIARASVMQYKTARKSIAEIARELRVDYVFEGRVRRIGERVCLTVQLVRVADQTQLWAERYEREVRDILALQRELAAAVAERIGPTLSPVSAGVERPRSVDPDAFEAYLKGRFHWYKLSAPHLDTALDYFHLALKKDPGFAWAYEGIARVWMMRGDAGLQPPGETVIKAKTAALQALEIDSTLAAAHLTLANIKFCTEWDWSGAEQAFKLALDLNPNSAEAHFFYSDFLISIGRDNEAAGEMDRALQLDPFNFFLQCFFGWHLVYRHDYDRAIAQLRMVLQREPHFSSAHLGLWGALAARGHYREALEAARRFFASLTDSGVHLAANETSGEEGYRRAMVDAADTLAARAATAHVPAIRVARLYAQGGDAERALEWLERAYERRESPLVHLRIGWDWRELQTLPRFRGLLRRIGLDCSRDRADGAIRQG